jgi:probable phosphomutase (TIGR03848 family)
MPTVVLARHGRTAANADGVLAGRSKGIHLDEAGVEQASSAATRLDGVPLARAVTSPLERCRETAKILLHGTGTRPRVDSRLVECDYGEWAGQKLRDLMKQPLWKTVQGQPSAARFPGGESLADMSARVVAAVRGHDAAVEAEHGPEAIWLAVSHGDLIKAVLADALGMHLDAFQRIVVHPGSLSVVRYTPQRTFVVEMNTLSGSLQHLVAPPRKPGSRRRRPSGDAPVGGGAGPGRPSP